MKGLKLRFALAALLSAAITAAAAEQRPTLYCGAGRLDLPCGLASSARAPGIGFAPLDDRYASKAYVVRFGEGKKANAEPRLIVQLGHFARQALFWAAVVTTFLL